jgi:NAD(P)-dependent dehydrogenase (short-subunit alcohol dehydrogenase family)
VTDQSFRLDNQLAIVTGACGKLGPVWIEALVDAGARVAAFELAGVHASAGYSALASRAGDLITRFDCDITDRTSIEAAVESTVTKMGQPAVLVNNAGIDQPPDSGGNRSRIENLAIDQFRQMVEVNLLGTFQVTRLVARMAARGSGSIINIGSLYASVSPDQRFYDT